MKNLLCLLSLLFAFSANAVTYYVSDCQAGADPSCVAGSNAADGLTTSTPKQTYTQLAQTPGTVIHLANGGSWTQSTAFVVTCATCVSGNSITWDTYTPSWCTSTCASTPTKPLITQTGTSAQGVFQFGANSGSGFLVSGLKLVGPNTGTAYGIYLTEAKGATITNVDVSAFYIGIFAISKVKNLVITSSNIHDNLTQGFLGAAQGLLIEKSAFDNNGFYGNPINGDHNIYLTPNKATEPFGVRTVIRHNTLTNSARCTAASTDTTLCPTADGLCKGVSLVAHRAIIGLVIENNVFDETTNGAAGGCYGIQLAQGDNEAGERYDGAVIRGNRFTNVGQRAIHVSNCPFCVIENNVAAWTTANASISLDAIRADSNGGISPYLNTRLVIRNNSIYIGAGSNATWTGIMVATDGTGHRVYNNVVYLAAGTSSSMSCYSTLPFTAFTTWDYNLCFRSGGVNTYSNLYANLAAAQAAGMGVHDSVSDPLLAATPAAGNSYNVTFTNGPTKNGGRAPCPRTTYGGFVRSGICDIGANQQGASVVAPNSPTFAR